MQLTSSWKSSATFYLLGLNIRHTREQLYVWSHHSGYSTPLPGRGAQKPRYGSVSSSKSGLHPFPRHLSPPCFVGPSYILQIISWWKFPVSVPSTTWGWQLTGSSACFWWLTDRWKEQSLPGASVRGEKHGATLILTQRSENSQPSFGALTVKQVSLNSGGLKMENDKSHKDELCGKRKKKTTLN